MGAGLATVAGGSGYPRVARRRVETVEDQIVSQIDDLQRQSDEARNSVLGSGFFERLRRWYNFDPPGSRRVAYHPLIRVADLQMITLKEAWEVTAPHPKFFIQVRSQRDEHREKAFNAQWRHLSYQMELLHANCFAGICGTGVVQWYFDPDYRHGKGAVRIEARDPETYFPDPAARRDADRSYVILEDFLTVEEIASRYGPFAAQKVSVEREGSGNSGRIPKTFIDFPANAASLPPGPMRGLGPLGGGAFSGGNTYSGRQGRIRVRTLMIKDSTRLPMTDELRFYLVKNDNLIPEPDNVPAFPNGRVLVEAQRQLLFDGSNPYRSFPVRRIPALPALYGYWAPPPPRFTQDLQELAEDMLSQAYENAYRMNNVMMFVQRISGLTSNDITGLPGTVYFTDAAAGEKSVQVVTPPQFPSHFLEYPKFLMQMQRELRGMGDARAGQSGAGNVGTGLFDSQVYQQQSLTRLRSALYQDVVQDLAENVFATMVDLGQLGLMNEVEFPLMDGGQIEQAVWHYDEDLAMADWEVMLDTASMRIDSATSLRNLAMALARFGLIDQESLLESLDWPDPQRLLKRVQDEKMRAALMAMLSGQNQAPKGKKK